MGQAQSQPAASPVEVRPLRSSHAFPPPPPSQRQSTSPPQAFELPPAVAIVPPTNLAASIAETPRSVPAPPPTPAVHAASEMMSGMDRLVTSPLDPSLAASMAGPSHHVPPSTPAVAGMPQLDPPIPVYGGISPPSTPPRTVAPPPVATVAPAPKTMKAWVLRKRGTGAADEAALTLEAAWPVVAPGKGQMRVRVICAALNPVDAKKVTLFGSSATLELPSILGCDGSGVVESLGEEDPLAPFAVAPGDRVYFHNHVVKPTQGTFAEYTICDAGAVCRIADNVSFADAAAVPCAGWTAFVGLFDKLRLQPGSTLLVLGAAGGVGSFAVSLAKLCGCRVIATCSASSTSYVKSFGADVVVDRELPNGKLQDTLKGYAPFDAAFDAVGACSVPGVSTIVASVLRFGSGLCSVLPLTPETEHPFVSNQLSRHYVYLGGHHNDRATQKVLKAVGDSVMQLMSVGVPDPSSVAGAVKRLPSHLSELIQFSQLRQGLLAMESKGTRGKIVMSFAVPAVAKKAPVPS